MNAKSANQQRLFKSCEQFVTSLYRTFDTQPPKLKAFINLFYRNKRSSSQPLESQVKLVELIQDFPDLVEQLNKLVPEEFRVSRLDQPDIGMQEENGGMDLQTAIEELNAKNPDKAEGLNKIIREIQDNRTAKTIEIFKEKLRLLLQEEEPYLYNLVVKYFQVLWDENIVNKEADLEPIDETSNAVSLRMEQEPKGLVGTKFFEAKNKMKPNKRPLRPDGRGAPPVINPSERLDATALPPTIRNELIMFEYLQTNLSREEYDQLMKIIYLYTECVLGAGEVLALARDIFEENENYFSFFCDIITTREITRRKNTTIFKPLGETDFKKMNCERNGSYTKVPDFFPYMKSPIHPKNPKAYKFLNQTWISVPQGSEVNFKIKAKNAYEENLFKCEDERYEFDTLLYNCSVAINWLNDLENHESEEKLTHMVERILRLKVIQKIYNNNPEIVEIFRKTPINVAKVLAERIHSKLRDIKDTKFNQARRKWHETSQENFHRSLDHRSFYFKQYEKKFTNQKTFMAEANTRYTELNIQGKIENLSNHWKILNTFEGISNGVECKYEDNDNTDVLKLVKRRPYPIKNLPIFRLEFSNQRISQDIFDMLCLRVQNFHANLTEKDKINRYIKVFMLELLQLPYELGRTYDLTFDSKIFLDIVSRIEAKIYDKSFNFNTAKMDETEKHSVGETIYSAIDKLRYGNKDPNRKREYEENGYNKDTLSYTAANGPNASNKKMDEDLTAKKNPTESLDDDLGLDSGSEDQTNVREMEYATANHKTPTSDFIPQMEKGEIMFYGTQHIYHLMRFYFALYERFLKAYEISQEFEENSKTAVLTNEEKRRLSLERYETFKWVLAHLVRSNIDNEKYEDLLRSIFGNKAYLMFYIDKILHLIIITIQKLLADDISLKSLNLYPEKDLLGKNLDTNPKASVSKPKDWLENVYLGQLNHLTLKNMSCLQLTTFFRFLYDPRNSNLAINMYNSPYKDWNDKALDSIVAYTQAYQKSLLNEPSLRYSSNAIFMRRAKERNRKKTVRVLLKIEQRNTIDWKYMPNTFKLVTESFHQEDFVIILKRKQTPAKEMLKKASSQFIKTQRFKEWHTNALQSMSKLP